MMETVAEAVAEQFCIGVNQLFEKARSAKYSFPRHIASYILHKHYGCTFVEIGRFFNRDHSTVSYSVQQIEYQLPNHTRVNQTVNAVLKKLGRSDEQVKAQASVKIISQVVETSLQQLALEQPVRVLTILNQLIKELGVKQ